MSNLAGWWVGLCMFFDGSVFGVDAVAGVVVPAFVFVWVAIGLLAVSVSWFGFGYGYGIGVGVVAGLFCVEEECVGFGPWIGAFAVLIFKRSVLSFSFFLFIGINGL